MRPPAAQQVIGVGVSEGIDVAVGSGAMVGDGEVNTTAEPVCVAGMAVNVGTGLEMVTVG